MFILGKLPLVDKSNGHPGQEIDIDYEGIQRTTQWQPQERRSHHEVVLREGGGR